MATYGPAGVSIERITDAAGVSRGLVRHHFGSKRQLLLEAFRRLADEAAGGVRRRSRRTDDDPVATLRAIVATEFRA